MDFPGGSDVKECAWNVGDPGSIPGSGRSSGEGNGNPLQVFLPGKSHGRRSLAGYSPWGHKESDTTEWLHSYMHASGHDAGHTHTYTHTHTHACTHGVLRHALKWMSVWEDMNHTHENLEKILSVTAIFVLAWWGTTVNNFCNSLPRAMC